jgi:sec-independent protein translocase protein TatC
MAQAPSPPPNDDAQGDVPMTIWEHLRELRKRLIASLLGMIPGVAVAWYLREDLLDFLVAPLASAWMRLSLGQPELHFSNPVDPFVAYLRIAFVVGLIFSTPWIAYQAWAFIAPALYTREKLYAIPFALASAVFFAGGAFFGYKYVFPVGFESLLGMAGILPSHVVKVAPTIMIDEYLSFATQMLLGFGVVFEVPVVVAFLAMAGLVNWKQLLKFGRYWVLIASVIAAVLTPSPDIGSQLMMMAPLVILYYAAVGVAYLIGPKPEPASAGEDDARAGEVS